MMPCSAGSWHPASELQAAPLEGPPDDAGISDEIMDDDELYQAVKLIVFRMHFDYAKPQPTEQVLIGIAMSWRDHLKAQGVPPEDVPLLYAETVAAKARTSGASYMPVIGDMLNEWDKWLEQGYWERRNAPEPQEHTPALPAGKNPLPGGINTDNAPEFVKIFADYLRRGGPQIQCACKVPATLQQMNWGSFWTCGEGVCDFSVKANEIESLIPNRSAPEVKEPESAPAEPRPEYSDDEILKQLSERCGYEVQPEKRERWIEFARHFESKIPVAVWSRPIAIIALKKFKDGQGKSEEAEA